MKRDGVLVQRFAGPLTAEGSECWWSKHIFRGVEDAHAQTSNARLGNRD